MNTLKLGVIKEGKNPPDKRVPLTPNQCVQLIKEYSNLDLTVQSSPVRIFKDEAYSNLNVPVVDSLEDRDVIIGVKEVNIEDLLPNKTYLFFSHTIKEQPYNRELLRAILDKNIRLLDWEVLTDPKRNRLIGFGRYAGIVGAYNGLIAYGKRTGKYDLKPAYQCEDRVEMEAEFSKLDLPVIKILLTGTGRVAHGAEETLDRAGIQKVTPEEYLEKSFDYPVYTRIGVEHYNKRKDGKPSGQSDFYKNSDQYESDFMRWAKVSDMFIAGHFYAEGSPYLFTRKDAKSSDFNIQVVADISCDIDGPVASTIKPSTINDPIYGYNPQTESEDDFTKSDVITVMAVDNLPCELPKDASESFGEEFSTKILPAFFNGDQEGILDRATMTLNGKLTERFSYLQDYVDGKH